MINKEELNRLLSEVARLCVKKHKKELSEAHDRLVMLALSLDKCKFKPKREESFTLEDANYCVVLFEKLSSARERFLELKNSKPKIVLKIVDL